MRRLTAMNFIHQFTWAVIVITLPLYLIYKGINVEEIGLILSLVPLAMIFMRVFLAMLADRFGTKIFFIGHSIMQILATLTYIIATIPIQFGIGKLFEGTSYSFFWAVDRTAIFATAKNKAKAATEMSSVRMIAAALGMGLGGFLAFEFSFEFVYFILVGLGVISLILAVTRRDTPHHTEKLKETLSLKNKDKDYLKTALVMGFALGYFSLFFIFLLPVFLDLMMGLDSLAIGLFCMLFFLGMSLGMYVATRMGLEESKLYILQLFTIPLIIMLPYTGGFFLPVLFLIGLGTGIVFGIYEELIVVSTEKEEINISTSVALLNTPGRVIEFAVLAGSGFVYMFLGYEAVFLLCALFLLLFIVFAKKILDSISRSKIKAVEEKMEKEQDKLEEP